MSESQTTTPSEENELPEDLINIAREAFSSIATENNAAGSVSGSEVARKDASNHLDFAKHINSYITDYIKVADQKAAFIFAAASALISYLIAQKENEKWLKSVADWSFFDGLSFLGMAGLFIALISACVVILPRLAKSHPGLIAFMSVAENESASCYSLQVRALENHELAESISKHSFDISKVCTKKYKALFVSMWALGIGAVISIFTLLL
ncbi:MAG: Pycsar system effector family protein [Candidatus Reddybacter sp.]